jgi:hypothetical protein
MIDQSIFPESLPNPISIDKEVLEKDFKEIVEHPQFKEGMRKCIEEIIPNSAKFNLYFDLFMLMARYSAKEIATMSDATREKFVNEMGRDRLTPERLGVALTNLMSACAPDENILFPNVYAKLEMLWSATFIAWQYFGKFPQLNGDKPMGAIIKYSTAMFIDALREVTDESF